MTEVNQGVHFIPELNSAACSLLSSYTLISILDHERWMKEWGDDHEAEAVMHLRTPILSAAVAMGLGGITTVHQVSLSAIYLDGEIELGANVLCTCLTAVLGIATMLAMLYLARMDTFAGVGRVERLKEVILKKHTISELKLKKGLGKKVAYMGKLHHVALAGTMLAMGTLGCWAVNMLGLTGDFVLVWKTQGIVLLAVYLLAMSIVSCWLLFRVLVWKPSYEYLRPLCSVFLALSLWSVDLCGKMVAITFEVAEDGLERGGFGWSLPASSNGGAWLTLMVAFGAVLTQYAIALELRIAYCGLQDTNLDLQLLAGTGAPEEHIRKTSAIHNNTSKRRHTGGSRGIQSGSRSPPARSRRRSVVVHASGAGSPSSPGSPGSPVSPGSPNSQTMYLTRTFSPGGTGEGDRGGMNAAQITTSASVVSAVFRMGSKSVSGLAGRKQSRSIRVQPATPDQRKVLVYEPSVAEDPEEDKQHHPRPGWAALQQPTPKPPVARSPSK
ncbi:unnamed protein product, partial [Scytosiphon promiscuus]